MSRIAGAYRKSGGGFLGVSGVLDRECEAEGDCRRVCLLE